MDNAVHIRNETNELRLLFTVGQTLEATGELGRQMQTILDLMARHTAMLYGGITLVPGEEHTGATWLGGAEGGGADRPSAAEREAAESVVLETLSPVAMPARTAADAEKPAPIVVHRGNMRAIYKEDTAFFCVPVSHGDRIFGTLSADRLFADSVAVEEDVRLLQVIASQLAQSLKVRFEVEARHSAVVAENRRLQALLQDQFRPEGMVGSSDALQAVFSELVQVAASNATVLIRGESGTGKELTAAAIHANSPRSGKPFVRLNCAALPEGLVESELFGHERGAFTGAVGTRKGRFEMAHGGTLFLDEVGDLTALTQAKLLRVLQEKEFERVGGTQTLRVDVRLIAATNRDLEQMVGEGLFRQDLYYRLSVFPIMLPPLRKRRDDIMTLATHFIGKYGQENNRLVKRVSPGATALLINYDWPGNIRELENVIERAVLLCGPEGVIEAEHLPPALQAQGSPPGGAYPETGLRPEAFAGRSASPGPLPGGRPPTLDEALGVLEKQIIVETLQQTRGNMAKAAERLGITERIMGLRMKKYGLSFKEFRRSGG